MSDSPLDERLRAREAAALSLVSRAPLRLRPDNLVERPWGGQRLLAYKGLEGRGAAGEGPRYGEVFEVAADNLDPEAAAHPSVVELADGTAMALPQLLELAGEAVLGESMHRAFGPRVPLLPKTLDVGGLLSVQTHPPARPEVYVVIDAEPGATLRLGFREAVDPAVLQLELELGRRDQEALRTLLRPEYGDAELQATISAHLAGCSDQPATATVDNTPLIDALMPALREASERPRLVSFVDRLVTLMRSTLARLNAVPVEAGQVLYNAHPATPRSTVTPSAEVHALGNLEGRDVLLLEIRRPGPTYRAWDHLRFPMREIAVDKAVASMNTQASDPASFVVDPVMERPGVHRSVACPAFIVDHLRPCAAHPVVEASLPGQLTTLHAIRGVAELTGPKGETWGTLRAGESALVPAGVEALSLRSATATAPSPDGEPTATACEVVQVIIPVDPTDGLRTNLAELRSLAPRSLGPRQVIAIVNGGDGQAVADRLQSQSAAVFRADGETQVYTHEEPLRRGQFLGLLDALRALQAERNRSRRSSRSTPVSGLDSNGVALGIMLPGKGTRLSPITQRLHGIKPLLPVPIALEEGNTRWLDAATASVWSWTLVAHTLERRGFRGIALKWGDEPQLGSQALAALNTGEDLSEIDAVRFGARAVVTEDLARNKEWLRLDGETGELDMQLHRRPRAELLRALGIEEPESGGEVHGLIHIGSPAFSHVFLRHAEAVYGNLDGWLDVDGYLFEALTHDLPTWQRELERDARLRAVIERCPDFYERAQTLKARIEGERGRPMRVAVIDFGEDLYWGDVGQLIKARRAFSALCEHPFARSLAGIEFIEPDKFGNRVVGDSVVPQDGSVRDCVIVDSRLGKGRAEGAVVVSSRLERFILGQESVTLGARLEGLSLGPRAFAFRSRGQMLRVPADYVHTSIPADPQVVARGDALVLESWFADMRVNPGTSEFYDEPCWGNPTSFAQKFAQMRQRVVSPDSLESRLNQD